MTAAPRTLLKIIQQAQLELSLPQAATVIGNVDGTTMQMLGLAQKIGEEIRDTPEDGWTLMHAEFDLAVPSALSATGTTAADSPTITAVSSTAGIIDGAFMIQGAGIPTAARIVGHTANTITMSMEATGTNVGTALNFAQDTFTLPSDFRAYSARTFWDRTNHWELIGPDSPQDDQFHRSGIFVTGPRRHFRTVGRIQGVNPTWRLWPPPFETVAPIQLAFEYLSTDWICVQGGAAIPPSPATYASEWANDTDIPVFDDRAMIDGIKWMFWEAKGFNWQGKRQDWVDLVDRLIARDGGSPTLRLARLPRNILLNSAQVPDGFWPGSTGPNTGI